LEAIMACVVRRVDYFYTTVADQPGKAYALLKTLADLGINLLAFAAVPIGPLYTQLTLFPEDRGKLTREAQSAQLVLDGPHPALMVQGDDELGALAELHVKLARASVNVYASTGVADGKGSFGYVLYVRPEEFEKASASLGV
jgi:predicted amino acid-binding ACT domain protein